MKISIISTISIFIICCCNVNNSEAESFAAIPLNEPFVIVLDDKSVGLWKEDLNYLIRMIKQTHPNPFFSATTVD